MQDYRIGFVVVGGVVETHEDAVLAVVQHHVHAAGGGGPCRSINRICLKCAEVVLDKGKVMEIHSKYCLTFTCKLGI